MSTKQIRFVHFDCEPPRMVLALAKAEYENVRVSFDQWKNEKPKSPFGQAPFIELDGKAYGQSLSISLHLAAVYGFYGQTNLDRLYLDEINHVSSDLTRQAVEPYLTSDAEEKARLIENLSENAPKFLQYFQRKLEANEADSGFFWGSAITVSDILVYDILWRLKRRDLISLEYYPRVEKLLSSVDQQLDSVGYKRGQPLY